jgi:hypothetical protein
MGYNPRVSGEVEYTDEFDGPGGTNKWSPLPIGSMTIICKSSSEKEKDHERA